ncbi:amino acid ABC transporter permease [Paenibacillus arenosi]|uniref:Amino acid ABC transporter permease n=1 Tax=Paenibacillus arenosi TaxID=2774142 RepID=A0ABR9AW11_9BACL|nr:amino acid ABC transporter permease [Paenibacillus arenosi]MBD8497422.1 amino acid ABC transporter permease [Paenibacillus arenosi]
MAVFETLWEYKEMYLQGAGVTLLLTLCSILFGVILGFGLVFMRLSEVKSLRWLATAYIEVFRGTPLLVQLLIIYFALPIQVDKFTAGVIAVGLNSAAYLAEIFRAGIQGVDKGQVEAARSLGMTQKQTMRFIVIPQALRSVLPAIGNEFIVIIKETSIVMVIGLADLMYNADLIRTKTYQPFPSLVGAAIVYFIMTFSMSKLIGRLERKLNTNDKN